MSKQTSRITRSLLDEPHVRGRRVTVLQVYDRVKRLGRDPEAVAEEYGLDVGDVHRALAYYYENPEEMAAVRTRRDRELDAIREEIDAERPDGVDPSA
jgi:uncharacterized protein (DUF433 family)